MTPATQQRLLELNRTFYATVADDFDGTRLSIAAGMAQSLAYLPQPAPEQPLTVLDVGCGNGRYAWALAQLSRLVSFVGVDADERLLAHAHDHARELTHVVTRFVRADLAAEGWQSVLPAAPAMFDVVVCFATLHHFPGNGLRRRILGDLVAALAPSGCIIVSAWQFLTSPRFVQKQAPWEAIGLAAADVEAGDSLLPWQQGRFALRYVHQIDPAEMQTLAADVGLSVADSYYADGKEGNLNYYTVLKRIEPS